MPSADEACARAKACWSEGDLDGAQAASREALAVDPSHPTALGLLAKVMLSLGAAPAAAALAQRASVQRPGDMGLRVLLARALNGAGEAGEALAVLDGGEETAKALLERAHALAALGRREDAREALGRVLALAAGDLSMALRCADALVDVGAVAAAVEVFERVAAQEPATRWAHRNHAVWLTTTGRRDEAAAVVGRGLQLQPADAELAHLQAGLEGRVLSRASDAFLKQHFDVFAAKFDEQLTALGYELPELIPALLARRAGEPGFERLDVLDAGCGTGLCASGLAPLARRLVGVDLSGGMLRKAAERGLYDDLVEAELLTWLHGTDDRFDAAVSADVFIYFGDLGPLLGGLARVLRPNGILIFSIETGSGGGYAQLPSGRFSHDPRLVARLLEEAGLAQVGRDPCTVRRSFGRPVDGTIFTALGRH